MLGSSGVFSFGPRYNKHFRIKHWFDIKTVFNCTTRVIFEPNQTMALTYYVRNKLLQLEFISHIPLSSKLEDLLFCFARVITISARRREFWFMYAWTLLSLVTFVIVKLEKIYKMRLFSSSSKYKKKNILYSQLVIPLSYYMSLIHLLASERCLSSLSAFVLLILNVSRECCPYICE